MVATLSCHLKYFCEGLYNVVIIIIIIIIYCEGMLPSLISYFYDQILLYTCNVYKIIFLFR
jgi:hypothetical protein